jgi:16S rRNA (guanine527-N7)-methyltransferase
LTVVGGKAERASGSDDLITARAVASLPKLLEMSTHLSTRKTRWILPKGRNAESELVEAQRNWHCEAELVPSCTDPDSRILVLSGVRAKGRR